MSERFDFNEGWLFHKGEIEVTPPATKGPIYTQAKTERYRRGPASIQYLDFPDDFGSKKQKYQDREIAHERWARVKLPHDYIIGQEPKKENNNALGYFEYMPAWYRKHFTVERVYHGKRIMIYFEGVTASCEIYLNGIPMCQNRAGYLPFEVDITDFVRFDAENVLAVHLTPDAPDGWWYAGAGIYRDVYLEIEEKVSVARYGLFLSPQKAENEAWNLPVELTLCNTDWQRRRAEVTVTVLSPEHKTVAVLSSACMIGAGEEKVLHLQTVIENPTLWDITSPALYKAVAEVKSAGGTSCAETTFGFRTVEFTPEGCMLNGRRVQIKGVCGHGDFGLTGKAVPDNIYRHKVRLCKEMGANAYRCSHYPQSPVLMDAFDREGLLVMAETRWFSSTPDAVEELRTLIKRDRNHPSVIMWSVGNEEPYFVKEEGRRIAKTLRREAKRLDPSRAVMTANDKTPDICTVYGESDLVGVNYNLNIFETLHEKFPHMGILSTECCATGSTRAWYLENSPEHGYIGAYDRDTNQWFLGRENTWKFIVERPWIMGSFQWISVDHRGEARWPMLSSQSGAMDMFLGKKDAFWQNLSHWSDTPMIHLLPHWNLPEKAGQTVSVWAYTNAEEAELFQDGVSLGKQKVRYPEHVEWQVEYRPGALVAVAYRGGKEVARDEKVTTGAAVALKLTLENRDDLSPNGKDLALITCTAVDEEGREVPNATPYVRFYCEGDAAIVGTGASPADHTPVTSPDRKMFAGRALVGVLPAKGAASIRLTAVSEGLFPTSLEIKF